MGCYVLSYRVENEGAFHAGVADQATVARFMVVPLGHHRRACSTPSSSSGHRLPVDIMPIPHCPNHAVHDLCLSSVSWSPEPVKAQRMHSTVAINGYRGCRNDKHTANGLVSPSKANTASQTILRHRLGKPARICHGFPWASCSFSCSTGNGTRDYDYV